MRWATALGFLIAAALHSAPAKAEHAPDKHAIECVALASWHEARGEGDQAQIAVGYVVVNRAASAVARWPADMCKIVRQSLVRGHCQFQRLCQRHPPRPNLRSLAWQNAVVIAALVLARAVDDPTNGATCFHDVSVLPAWAWNNAPLARIGRLTFYDCGGRRG